MDSSSAIGNREGFRYGQRALSDWSSGCLTLPNATGSSTPVRDLDDRAKCKIPCVGKTPQALEYQYLLCLYTPFRCPARRNKKGTMLRHYWKARGIWTSTKMLENVPYLPTFAHWADLGCNHTACGCRPRTGYGARFRGCEDNCIQDARRRPTLPSRCPPIYFARPGGEPQG